MSEYKKPTIFDTILAVSSTRPLTFHDIHTKQLPYEPFMVNRAFSLSEDAVRAAAVMNERPHLDKDMQATFYIHTLRARRRFEKWPKTCQEPDIDMLCQYYGMSRREARFCRGLHTDEQLTHMQKVISDSGPASRRT